MADQSQRLAIIITAQDLASGNLSKVKTELAGLSTSGKIAAVGIGTAQAAVAKGGQALSNLKNRLTSLAAPLAMIGVTGGLLSVSGALEQGISKAQQDATALENLKAVSADTTDQLAGLLAVSDHYNISAETLAGIVDKSTKAVGKLQMTTASATKVQASANTQALMAQKLQLQTTGAKTTAIDKLITESKAQDALNAAKTGGLAPANKLVQLQQQYGVTLTDSNGKTLGFTDTLLNLADAFQHANTAADKARVTALAGQVLGKGFAPLLPLLEQGSAGYDTILAKAKQYGDVLSQQNVEDLAKFKAAEQDAQQAGSGLMTQLGLIVLPDLTTGFESFANVVSTHRTDIQNAFKQGLTIIEGIGHFITGTLIPDFESIAGAAKSMWNMIPGPIKDLLIQGVAADRVTKFLFGMSPIHGVISLAEGTVGKGIASAIASALGGSGLGKIFGGFLQKGATPANPMFVSDVTKGIGLPGGGAAGGAETAAEGAGAAEVAGGIGAGTLLAGAAMTAVAAAAVGYTYVQVQGNLNKQSDALTSAIDAQTQDQQTTNQQLARSLLGTQSGQQQMNSNLATQVFGAVTGTNTKLSGNIQDLENALTARGIKLDPATLQALASGTSPAASGTASGTTRGYGVVANMLRDAANSKGKLNFDALTPSMQNLVGLFKGSLAPNTTSMASTLKTLTALEQRAKEQGDTKAIAAIQSMRDAMVAQMKQLGVDINGLGPAMSAAAATWQTTATGHDAPIGEPAPGTTTKGTSVTYRGGSTGGTAQHRAAGGPVWPGGVFTVGEQGREILRMGTNGMGYVTPMASAGGRGAGTIMLSVQVATSARQNDFAARVQSNYGPDRADMLR